MLEPLKTVGLIARWVFVFGILWLFSFQAAINAGFIGSDNVYAETIFEQDNWIDESNFIVIKGSDYRICVINQDQFNLIKNLYNAEIDYYEVDDRLISIAKVDKDRVTIKELYSQLQLEEQGSDNCKIIKHDRFYWLFTVPGVS